MLIGVLALFASLMAFVPLMIESRGVGAQGESVTVVSAVVPGEIPDGETFDVVIQANSVANLAAASIILDYSDTLEFVSAQPNPVFADPDNPCADPPPPNTGVEPPFGQPLKSVGLHFACAEGTSGDSLPLWTVTFAAPQPAGSVIFRVRDIGPDDLILSDDEPKEIPAIGYREADLELVKTANKAVVVAGDTLTYALTLTNNVPRDASGIVVQDFLYFREVDESIL
ncbi:MAG: hypothetical protein ACRDIB_17925, partial [Ardenticatenaceae bacterium]